MIQEISLDLPAVWCGVVWCGVVWRTPQRKGCVASISYIFTIYCACMDS
jgi:hypothetical protein